MGFALCGVMMTARTTVWLSLIALLAGGCGEEELETQSLDATEGSHALLPGPELVKCWAEKGEGDNWARVDALYCQRFDAAEFPIRVVGALNIATADSNHGGKLFEEIAVGEPTQMMKVYAEAYPIELKLDLSPDYATLGEVAGLEQAAGKLTHAWRIEQPDMEPQAVRFPYDLWSLSITARDATLSMGELASYAVDTAPFVGADGTSVMTIDRGFLPTLDVGRSASMYVAVGRGAASVPAGAEVGDTWVDFELTGPGRYLVEGGTVRPQQPSDEEALSDGPAYASCRASDGLWSCRAIAVAGVTATALSASVAGAEMLLPLDGSELSLPLPEGAVLPLSVSVTATLDSDAIGFRDDLASLPLTAELTLAEVEVPVEARLPFDLMNVTIDPAGATFGGDIDPYQVLLGAEWAGLSTLVVSNQQLPYLAETTTLVFVVSSQQQSVTANAYIVLGDQVNTDVAIEMQRGGSYTVTATGLVPSTTEEGSP